LLDGGIVTGDRDLAGVFATGYQWRDFDGEGRRHNLGWGRNEGYVLDLRRQKGSVASSKNLLKVFIEIWPFSQFVVSEPVEGYIISQK
jgi:hypothetical protein